MLEQFQAKERVIQEYVPGKQITLAHLIANPNKGFVLRVGKICADFFTSRLMFIRQVVGRLHTGFCFGCFFKIATWGC